MATFKEFDTGSDQITQLCYFCDSNVSDGFCGVCEDFMCQSCFNMHTKAKSCRHHVLLDGTCQQGNKKTYTETCTRHPNQSIKFYCVAHKIVGCVECFFPEHRNCNYQNIETAAKLFQDSGEDTRLKKEIQRLENTHSEYTRQYEDDKETVAVINNTVVKDVKSFTDSVTSYVAQVEKHMLEQSERLRIENKTRLERRSDDLDSVGTEIEKFKMKLENEDRVDRLFISAIEIGPAIEKLRKNIASIGRQHAVTKYEFQPNKLIMEMTNGSGSFGDICILQDVDAVLGKVPIKFMGHVVEVERYEPEPEEPIDPCTVLVSGPEAVLSDLESLEYYFESTKRSGGGDIAVIKYDEDLNVVEIQFEEEEAAQRVIEKKDHKVKKQTLTVEQFRPVKQENVSEYEDFEDAKETIADTVKVSGVPASIRSTVELYFENPKRSGGGDYDKCWSDQEDEDVIYIKFNDIEDAHNVLERSHEVKGKKLAVELYIPAKETHSVPEEEDQTEGEHDEEIIYDTVKVTGVDPAKRRTVELWFENTRRSGGDEYESIWSDNEDEGVIYIKYRSEEVAKTVANRSHKVDKCELEVSLYTPAKETRSVPRQECKQDEETIKDTVKVVGVDKSKRNTVELYFENTRRSGGGEYESIWSDEEEEGVIYIRYSSEEVAETVASRSHRVENCELKVSMYLYEKSRLVKTRKPGVKNSRKPTGFRS